MYTICMATQTELTNLHAFHNTQVFLNTAKEVASLGTHYDIQTGQLVIEPLPDFETIRHTQAITDVVIAVPAEYEGAMDRALLEIEYPDTKLLQIIVIKIAADEVILYQSRLKSSEESTNTTAGVLEEWKSAIETVTDARLPSDLSDSDALILLTEGSSEKKVFDSFFDLYAQEQSSLPEEVVQGILELHEGTHGRLDRSHLPVVKQVLEISQHAQFGDLIRHHIGMSAWLGYARLLNELNILDEAVATFHSLRGQKEISDELEGDFTVDTSLFGLSILAVHVAHGYTPITTVELDVEESLSSTSKDPLLFVSVGKPITNIARSSTFLFQGDLESDAILPEPHVASALLLLAGESNLRTDSRHPLLVHGDDIDVVARVRHFIDNPQDVPKFLNPSFYTKLLKAYANRIEKVKGIAGQIIEVFDTIYATNSD